MFKITSRIIILIAATAFIITACSEKIEYPEGLEVTDQERGSGDGAQDGDYLVVHYTGSLTETDEVFDSSLDRQSPFRFKLGNGDVIQGWDKGLVGMREGGKRTLIIDAPLAYGDRGAGGVIPPGAQLKFEVELLEIISSPVVWDYNESDVIESETGLKYVIVEEGEGPEAEAGNRLDVFYAGFLDDGTMFDSSVGRPGDFSLQLGSGSVIPGWEEGLKGMKEGEKRVLIIPSDLAYGDRGAGNVIPPNAELTFTVELKKIH